MKSCIERRLLNATKTLVFFRYSNSHCIAIPSCARNGTSLCTLTTHCTVGCNLANTSNLLGITQRASMTTTSGRYCVTSRSMSLLSITLTSLASTPCLLSMSTTNVAELSSPLDVVYPQAPECSC